MPLTQKTEQERRNDVLSVSNLSVSFKTRGETVVAVNSLSFRLLENEVLGIVGESGSGKSQTVLSIMGLLESNGRAKGSAVFKNKEMLGLPEQELNKIRGNEMAMIFQDPMSSLNPYITIGDQMVGVLKQHKKQHKKEARERCIEMLDAVRLPNPEKRIDGYSFELSGGMRQRVMIATALLTNPDLLVADEPTTALDVTVQEKILDLILEVRERFSMSVILITHDLGVVARTCDNVLVLKNGTKQEYGNINQIFYSPQAEHTRELLFKSKELSDAQAITKTKTKTIEKPNICIKSTDAYNRGVQNQTQRILIFEQGQSQITKSTSQLASLIKTNPQLAQTCRFAPLIQGRFTRSQQKCTRARCLQPAETALNSDGINATTLQPKHSGLSQTCCRFMQ